MQKSPLVVIMAHSGAMNCSSAPGNAQAVFDRHYEYWKLLGCKLLVYCPQNGVVRTSEEKWIYGNKEHHGRHSISRFNNLMLWLYKTQFDKFIIFEYDSLLFSPSEIKLIDWDCLTGNVFENHEPSDKFWGKYYIHPPLCMGREVLDLVKCHEKNLTERSMQDGFWDRYLGLVCETNGIKLVPFGPKGFSRNTIEPNGIAEAKGAVRDGAVWIHGIKTAEVLDNLSSEYMRRCITIP